MVMSGTWSGEGRGLNGMLNHVVFNVLKNPNPLNDDEASALLVAAVLVLALF